MVWVLIEHFLSGEGREALGHRMSVNTQIFALLSGLTLGKIYVYYVYICICSNRQEKGYSQGGCAYETAIA